MSTAGLAYIAACQVFHDKSSVFIYGERKMGTKMRRSRWAAHGIINCIATSDIMQAACFSVENVE